MNNNMRDLLRACRIRYDKQPECIPSNMGTDAPILGNGNMVCAFAGWEESPEFYITANDFWRLENSGKLGHVGPRPAARLVFDIPALQGSKTMVEQDLYRAVIMMRAERDGVTVEAAFRVCAEDNLLMAQFSARGGDVDVAARFARFPINMVAPYDTFLATRKIPNEIELVVPAEWKDRISSIRLNDGDRLIREFSPAEGVEASEDRIAMPWNEVLKGAAVLSMQRVNFSRLVLSCEVAAGCCTGDESLCTGGDRSYIRDGVVLTTGFWAACGGYTNGFFVKGGKWALRWYDQWVVSDIPAGSQTRLEAVIDNEKMTFRVGGEWTGECIFEYYPEENAGCDGEKLYHVRRFSKSVALPTEAACAARFVGSEKPEAVTVKDGTTVSFVLALRTLFKTSTPLKSAAWRILALNGGEFGCLEAAHEAWWRNFWRVSGVEFGDSQLLKSYYLSQYLLGSISRDPEFPPHIFGVMTSDYPEWNGDYHLNYNHQVPFLAMISSGRLEQSDPCDTPILAYMDRGRFHSWNELNLRGVYYPCGIGPKGTDTASGLEEPGLFHGQRSNAAFSCVNLAMRWYSSYEPEYGLRIYPMVRAAAEFWEDYLTLEDGRYVILNDAVQENSGEDKNGILSLGLIRLVLELGIDLAKELGIRDGKTEKWEEINSRLAPYPVRTVGQVLEKGIPPSGCRIHTALKDTDKVFVLSEGGRWAVGCTLITQHIYPGGAVGPGDEVELLETARNTVQLKTEYDGMTGAWRDFNHMNMFYPSAVRAGFDGRIIWEKLKEATGELFWQNGFDSHAPFAENLSLVPNTVNEMLLQSYKGVIRVFHAWPVELEPDAAFDGLVAYGAFEVSAVLRGGEVRSVDITSRRGRVCRVQNPWKAALVRVGEAQVRRTEDAIICLETKAGGRIRIIPCRGSTGM